MKSDLYKTLKQMGLKATPTRITVLSYVNKTKYPFDIEEINTSLKKKDMKTDIVTIYRTLHVFESMGIIKKVELSEGKFRYESSTLPHHHHFICEHCGEIEDIGNCIIPGSEKKIEKEKDVHIRRHSLEFFGLCAQCKENKKG